MTTLHNPQIEKVYGASTLQQSRAAYDEWAQTYDADMFAYGYRAALVAATIWARFVKPEGGPILDAGCGTGLQAEPLKLAGYGPISGIDQSGGMLEIARQKNIYAELHQMALGERLSFDDNSFADVLSIGTITPGHAPPNSFDELIRVTGQGGLLVFSLRADDDQVPDYLSAMAAHEKANRWARVFETKPFASMPLGEPEVFHKICVYRTS
jgi:ubiquinone/menaquinone biosynthesis C-methylase UbiE